MLEYEIGGARDGWLNRMNFLSPLDEWEFLEKREPPLSLSLSLPQMGSKSRLLEWGSSVSINFDKPCVEFELTRLSSTMRVKNNRDELADEIYIYIYIYIHGWKTRSVYVHRGSVYRGRWIFPFRGLTARPMDYLSSLYQPRQEKWRSFVSGGRTSANRGNFVAPRSNDAHVPLSPFQRGKLGPQWQSSLIPLTRFARCIPCIEDTT